MTSAPVMPPEKPRLSWFGFLLWSLAFFTVVSRLAP